MRLPDGTALLFRNLKYRKKRAIAKRLRRLVCNDGIFPAPNISPMLTKPQNLPIFLLTFFCVSRMSRRRKCFEPRQKRIKFDAFPHITNVLKCFGLNMLIVVSPAYHRGVVDRLLVPVIRCFGQVDQSRRAICQSEHRHYECYRDCHPESFLYQTTLKN